MHLGSKNRFLNDSSDDGDGLSCQNDMDCVGGVLTFGAGEFFSSKREKKIQLMQEQQLQQARAAKRHGNDENLINIPATDFYTTGAEKLKPRPQLSSSNRKNNNAVDAMMLDGCDSSCDIATLDNVGPAVRKLTTGVTAVVKPSVMLVHTADKENHKIISEGQEWQAKQGKLYSEWMNFMFSKMYSIVPVDERSVVDSAGGGAGGVDAAAGNNHIHDALVMKEYGFISQNAKFLLKAQCDIGIFRMLDRECNCGNIQMKDDRDITVDVGLQADLMELLFSYELPWLKLGLEIVSNKTITIKKNGETVYTIVHGENSELWKKSMKVHVLKNILYDAGIASQFQAMRAQTIKTDKFMKDAFRKHALKMLLSLIFLLDKFREAELLKLPSLFQKESGIKSSKEIMLSFCKNFMKGEGDFSKHLNELGFITNFKQAFSDEFDYRISDISTDLRDGVRLAKLLEMLHGSQYAHISHGLRVPAVSRLQKIHNVEKVVGAAIQSEPAKISKLSSLIVEGNMTATFSFLWEVFFRHEASNLIDDSEIYKEIKAIRANMEWRRSVYGEVEAMNFAVKVPVRMQDTGNIDYPPIVANSRMETELDSNSNTSSTTTSTPSNTSTSNFTDQNHISGSLQDWCHTISCQYGIGVDNLESSLSDGRVLCLLIHYYHPKVLPLRDIHKPASRAPSTRGLGEGISMFFSAEKKNFSVLKSACRSIGGIPWMLDGAEKGTKLDEKTLILFLSYLFNRLIESSNSVRAAIKLQRWFRSFQEVAVVVPVEQSMAISEASSASAKNKISITENPDITIFVSGKPHYYSALKIQRCWRKHVFRCRVALAFEKLRMERFQSLLDVSHEEGVEEGMESNDSSSSGGSSSSNEVLEIDLLQMEGLVESESEPEHFRRNSEGGKRRSSCINENLLLLRSEASINGAAASIANNNNMGIDNSSSLVVIDDAAMRRELENEIRSEYEQQRKQELENQRKLIDMKSSEMQQLFQSEIMKTKMKAEISAQYVESLENEKNNLDAMSGMLSCKLAEENERLQREREARLAAEAKELETRMQLQQLLEAIEREKQMKATASKNEELRKQAMKQQKKAAATSIQKIWRRFHISKLYNKVHRGVLTFQCNYRGYRVREEIRKQQREEQKRAWERSERTRLANIEAMERSRLASIEEANKLRRKHEESCANKIKSAWKSFLITLRVQKLVNGFKRLQAAFRSRKVLRTCSSKVLQMRLKLKQLDKIARKDTKLQLGHRTLYALQTLKEGKMISQYLKACQILEFSTRYSMRCCEAFAEAKASQILFGIIRSCNRSTPHEELLRNVMVVLLNVARRSHLAKAVGEWEECSEILVDRMQMSRDKKELFCLSTELLCRLVHANASQKVICNGYRSRIETILSILERKHRLDCKLKGIAPLAGQFTSPMKGDRRAPMSLDQLNMLSKLEPIESLQHLMNLLK